MQSNRGSMTFGVTVGRPEHILAAVERNGVLTLLGNHSTATRILLRSTGNENAEWVLVSETNEDCVELARGPLFEMDAMRRQISREVSAHMRRGKGRHRIMLMTVSCLVGLFIGATGVVGLMPAAPAIQMPPPIPGMMPGAPYGTMPPINTFVGTGHPDSTLTRNPSAVPLPNSDAKFLPGSVDPLPGDGRSGGIVLPENDPKPNLNEDLKLGGGGLSSFSTMPDIVPRGATHPVAAPVAGQASHPAAPVSLDDPIDAPAEPMSRPSVAPVSAPAQPPVIHSESKPATPGAVPGFDPKEAAAIRTLDALNTLRIAMASGGTITQSTLDALPPDIAARIKALPHNRSLTQRLSEDAVDAAGHDKYGIPNVPDTMSWAALAGPHIPMPGGGDLKTPADLKRFGMQP